MTFSTTPTSTGRPRQAIAARYRGTSCISARACRVGSSGGVWPNSTPCCTVWASKSRLRPRASVHGGQAGLAQKMSARGSAVMFSARASAHSWSALGKLAACESTATRQWLTARIGVTPGTRVAPSVLPPTPANSS